MQELLLTTRVGEDLNFTKCQKFFIQQLYHQIATRWRVVNIKVHCLSITHSVCLVVKDVIATWCRCRSRYIRHQADVEVFKAITYKLLHHVYIYLLLHP